LLRPIAISGIFRVEQRGRPQRSEKAGKSIVAFRSAKAGSFAERKATLISTPALFFLRPFDAGEQLGKRQFEAGQNVASEE
jgi:hypothetical protein